jgi:hypothetical protein
MDFFGDDVKDALLVVVAHVCGLLPAVGVILDNTD